MNFTEITKILAELKQAAKLDTPSIVNHDFAEIISLLRNEVDPKMLLADLRAQGLETEHGLDISVYSQLLAFTKLACAMEGNQGAQENAYKLAVAFGSEKAALTYLHTYAKQNPNTQQSVHDACLFSLPESNDWSVEDWREVFINNMHNEKFRKFNIIGNADKIQEKLLDKKVCVLKGDIQQSRQLINLKEKEIALEEEYAKQNGRIGEKRKTIAQLKKQGHAISQLQSEIDNDSKELKKIKADINKNKLALEKENKRIATDMAPELAKLSTNSLYDIAVNLTYTRANEDTEAALLFKRYNAQEADFNKWLELKSQVQNSDKAIPRICLNGSDHGIPDWYVIKLSDDDPKAAVLGEITACCQSLGKAGNDCAVNGITSDTAGFYVICRGKPPADGDTKRIQPKDIMAQAWVWRGKDGELVIDSIESQPNIISNEDKKQNIVKLTYLLSKEFVEKHNIDNVNIGTGGATPSQLGYQHCKAVEPKGYNGYRDSTSQSRLAEKANLFYLEMCLDFNKAIKAYKTSGEKVHYDQEIFSNILATANITDIKEFFADMSNEQIEQYVNANKLLNKAVEAKNNELSAWLLDFPNVDLYQDYHYRFEFPVMGYDGFNPIRSPANLLRAALLNGLDDIGYNLIKDRKYQENNQGDLQKYLDLKYYAIGYASVKTLGFLLDNGDELDLSLISTVFNFDQKAVFDYLLNRDKEEFIHKLKEYDYIKLLIVGLNQLINKAPDFIIKQKMDFMKHVIDKVGVFIPAEIIQQLNDPSSNYDYIPYSPDSNLLNIAIEFGIQEIVDKIIEEKVDINLPNNVGTTPLHTAIANKQDEIAIKLVKAGALIDCPDRFGVTPISMASEELAKEIYKIVEPQQQKRRKVVFSEKQINKSDNEIMDIILQNDISKTKDFLTQNNIYVDTKIKDDENHCTLLMFACQNGLTEMAEELIKLGAQVNALDEDGDAVLVYAAESDLDTETKKAHLSTLIQSGAQVTTEILERLKDCGEPDVLDLLKDHQMAKPKI